MHFYRPLIYLLGAGALSACAVGPDYHRPQAGLPAHFMAESAFPAGPGARTSDLTAWWSGFDDPLLTRYVDTALAQNLDLSQALARVSEARAAFGATNAALLPSADVSGSAARAYQAIDTPLGQLLNARPGYDRWGNEYESDLSASWEIDISGGLRRDREAALADYKASEAGAVATRLTVAAQTADIYIGIRGLQTRLDIANQQVGKQQDLLALLELMYGKGVVPDYQVRQAEGTLAQTQAEVSVLRARLDAAMNALDVMLGTPPGTHRAELETASPIPRTPSIAVMGTPADLLQRRPDLIAAERCLAASNARIGSAISEYYPKLSLSALLGSATALSSGSLFSSGANQRATVLGLRWRLFDFGRINAEIDNARGQQAEALAAYRQAALRATEDVEDAFSALFNSEAQATTLLNGESSLSEARDSQLAAYQRGVASRIDVLRADEALLQISDARAQAQSESARAAVATYKALGGGWNPQSLDSALSRSVSDSSAASVVER